MRAAANPDATRYMREPMTPPAPPLPPIDTDRRGLLGLVASLLAAALAAVVAVPAVAAIIDPFRRRTIGLAEPWVSLGPGTRFAAGAPFVRLRVVGARQDGWSRSSAQAQGSVLVRRDASGKLLCFSAECPHLGCAVSVSVPAGFSCPCHDSVFAVDGAVTRPPAPRGLDALEIEEEKGIVRVRFQRFRQGIATREVIG